MLWLVAEDETDIRVLVTTMFQIWGHEAVAYENGQKVWDWLDSVEKPDFNGRVPDLVLMDIRMPGRKGNEIAQRMRSISALDQTPIALMTAFALSDGERREMAENDGVDVIISKPLPEFEQLRALLHALVEQKKTPAPANSGVNA